MQAGTFPYSSEKYN